MEEAKQTPQLMKLRVRPSTQHEGDQKPLSNFSQYLAKIFKTRHIDFKCRKKWFAGEMFYKT